MFLYYKISYILKLPEKSYNNVFKNKAVKLLYHCHDSIKCILSFCYFFYASVTVDVITLGIVLTMIDISNSNRTSFQEGAQSRTDAYI